MSPGVDYRDEAADDLPGAVSERRSWIVDPADHGQRLDKLVARNASEFSRSHLQGLIETGHAQLDGQECRQPSRRVRAGQVVVVELIPTAEALAFQPQSMPLPIVFEDDQIIVIDKPVGLVVHPGAGNWSGTLLNGLLAHHRAAVRLPRAGIVHRLDKGTSGLMVVGKTLQAVTELSRAIATREVKREYAAIAHGVPAWEHQVIEGPIGRDPRSRLRMAVISSGKPARTEVWIEAAGQRMCAIVCRLHTGRTHQIRVHLSTAGHPLIGDTTYGGRPALGLLRPALHARRLAFRHPATGRWTEFESPMPEDLLQAWRIVVEGCGSGDGQGDSAPS